MAEPKDMIESIEGLTGRSADAWIALVPEGSYEARG